MKFHRFDSQAIRQRYMRWLARSSGRRHVCSCSAYPWLHMKFLGRCHSGERQINMASLKKALERNRRG